METGSGTNRRNQREEQFSSRTLVDVRSKRGARDSNYRVGDCPGPRPLTLWKARREDGRERGSSRVRRGRRVLPRTLPSTTPGPSEGRNPQNFPTPYTVATGGGDGGLKDSSFETPTRPGSEGGPTHGRNTGDGTPS